ncbi:thioredoxin-like domain-containing protein [Tautonia sociabilis]|uniref:Redoxin domain-containing protein n=1 Tax=Tautonia sociabilis TaxID=2080755 RepID=A0A432MP32_9BACT|nr:thioredoxin-like domain-containing protein [Tautonia sociabilis]RUL89213.1 redoxin domain-containing protein [Tautonia sociabilis]
MRAARSRAAALAAAAVAMLGGQTARVAQAQQLDVPSILKENRPVQRGVEYDSPSSPAEVSSCAAEVVPPGRSGPGIKGVSVIIRDGQGRTLRRFLDVSGDGNIDQWCYYRDGFEVYRDVDYNDDRRIDESRWLNTAGTRIAVVEGGKIASWRRLSAQEASKVLVDAIVSGDHDLLNTVMAAPEELAALGLPKGLVDQVRAELAGRKAAVEELTRKLSGWGWTNTTAWLRFDADMPHLIPADVASGLKDDLLLFENAVVFAGSPDGLGDLGQVAYLQVPELVRVGEAWKFVGLPRAFNPDPSQAEVIVAYDGIRSWLYREGAGAAGPVASGVSPELEKALRALADFDAQAVDIFAKGDTKAIAQYHYERVRKLRDVIAAAPEADRIEYEKEAINSLAAAYQTGDEQVGPATKKVLDDFVKGGGPLSSYAAFRLIPAEYSLRASKDPDHLVEAQKKWVEELEAFLKAYPRSAEVPEALFQLASIKEFNGAEDEARAVYDRLAKEFPDSSFGRKGAGALRRLDLVGQPIALSGPGADGQTVDASSMKGKHLLVVFGANSSPPTQRELPELIRLADRRKDTLAVIGVSLDGDPESAQAFASQAPWPTIVEQGGMESRLADEFGIISLPTMFLVDPSGKVVDRDVRSAVEVEGQLDEALAKKQ